LSKKSSEDGTCQRLQQFRQAAKQLLFPAASIIFIEKRSSFHRDQQCCALLVSPVGPAMFFSRR
jgi:hypothetical protein